MTFDQWWKDNASRFPVADYQTGDVEEVACSAWHAALAFQPEVGFVQSGSPPTRTEMVKRPGPPLPEDFGCSHHSWQQIFGPPQYIANYHQAAADFWRELANKP